MESQNETTIDDTNEESMGEKSRIAIPCSEENEGLIDFLNSKESKGLVFNFATFYMFCQRVSVGESNPVEIAFMTRMFDLIEKRGDWNVAVNDYLA